MERFSLKKTLLLICGIFALRQPAEAVNYYWVGGSGNWSDVNHWATTSGGAALQSIVPSVNDNVIFDVNSGFTALNKTVTINTGAFCDSMTWSGTVVPAALVLSSPLQVNGSFRLQPGMTTSGIGTITFTSVKPNESITTGNVLFTSNGVTFNGTGGWTLQDSLKAGTAGSITFTNGNLNLSGRYISAYSFSSSAINSRTLNIANAIIQLNYSWTYSGSSASLTALNTTGSLIICGSTGTFGAKAGDVYYNVQMTDASIANGVYNKVTYTNSMVSGAINNVTTDTLLLTPVKSYKFASGQTSTVNKYFQASSPACSGLIELYANTAGSQATLSVAASCIVNVANARIQDLKIQGAAAPYAASNSIDLGNNAGWTFTAPTTHTWYWVGGSGNWNDVNHWASASNGTAGSGCVPTQFDEVIFDNGSGFTAGSKTVTVNGNAYCDSMTWAGATVPATLALSNPLQVNGSLWFQPGMSVSGSYGITFASSRVGESITTGNISMATPITFNGTGGWNLQDSFKVSTYGITFTNGNLNFNGQYATMYNFSSITGNTTRILNLANSIIEVQNTWIYTGGVALTAPNSQNSLIINDYTSTSMSQIGKAGDVYYNVQMNTGGIQNGIYNKVSYSGSMGSSASDAINNITADTLILAAVKTYHFTSGASSTINSYLKASSPPCSGLIELLASSSGQSTINIGTGALVDVANARVQSMLVQGPAAPYAATASIDLGNNTGWTFTAPSAHTYYWVGGSGNWNNVNHWALASNGMAGSGCIPTQFDEVIFDGGSGFTAGSKTVTLDGNAYCDSMTWAGSAVPATLVLANPLQISGSFRLQPGMTVSGNALLTFNSSRPNEIVATGNVTFPTNGITFNGTGGWALQDSLKLGTNTTSIVTLSGGALNFNGQYATMYGFSSSVTVIHSLNIANAVVQVGLGGWTYTGTGGALSAITTAGSLIINSSSSTFTARTGDVYNNLQLVNGVLVNGTYNKISYSGDMSTSGGFINNIIADTLIFTAGGTYNFTSNATSVINNAWYASGNPCFPTTIKAATAGTRANVSMPATAANYPPSTYGIDFVRLKDMNAVTGAGRATLQIGNQSIDNGNNTNWVIIPYAGPSGITGLGNDTALYCNAYPYTLSTVAFMGNPSTSYLWYDNTATTTHAADTPGHYSIAVNYGSGCLIKDTIALSIIASPVLSVASAITPPNYQLTLTAGTLVGAPLYTLDSVQPAGTATTPVTQASNVFTVPITTTAAFFHVTDQTSGCMAAQVFSIPLPVVVSRFYGTRNGTDNLLFWTTQYEDGIADFELESAPDGKSFEKIAAIPAQGGSGGAQNYSYTDREVLMDAYYRLRTVDQGGNSAYSTVLRLGAGGDACMLLEKIYPQPFTDELQLSFRSCRGMMISMQLLDMNGKRLRADSWWIPTGISGHWIRGLGALPKGLYMLRLETADSIREVKIIH